MERLTIAFGLALCAATLVILLNIDNGRITTAFVPIIFGIPIFIAGVISLNPHRRRLWLRVAGYVALAGGLGALLRVVQIGFRWTQEQPVYLLPTCIAGCLAMALLGFASFLLLNKKLAVANNREYANGPELSEGN